MEDNKQLQELLKEEYEILLSDKAKKHISFEDYLKLDEVGIDATIYWKAAQKGIKVEDFIKGEELTAIIEEQRCKNYEMHKFKYAWMEEKEKALKKKTLSNGKKLKDEWERLKAEKIKIEYDNSDLQKAVEDVRFARKTLGAVTAKNLHKAVEDMKKYSNVCEYLSKGKGNPKPLIFNLKGDCSTKIDYSTRLVWKAKQDGRNDTIILKYVSEYHNQKDNVRI